MRKISIITKFSIDTLVIISARRYRGIRSVTMVESTFTRTAVTHDSFWSSSGFVEWVLVIDSWAVFRSKRAFLTTERHVLCWIIVAYNIIAHALVIISKYFVLTGV